MNSLIKEIKRWFIIVRIKLRRYFFNINNICIKYNDSKAKLILNKKNSQIHFGSLELKKKYIFFGGHI